MSDSAKIGMGDLYGIVLREAEHDALQELPDDLYLHASRYVGELKRAEYDGAEASIKNELIELTARMISLLIRLRTEKAASERATLPNLTDEEKYVMHSAEEMQERREMVMTAVLSGKSKLLESISERHRARLVAVRFLKAIDRFVGADMEEYGPFEAEDVANIPYENAHVLIDQKAAVKIRWEH